MRAVFKMYLHFLVIYSYVPMFIFFVTIVSFVMVFLHYFMCLRCSKAEGYADGDYTLHHVITAVEFLLADNHLELLAGTNQVSA